MTDEYEIQGRYGPIYGFERVTTEETLKEAQDTLAVYRQNEKGIPFRIVKKKKKKKCEKL